MRALLLIAWAATALAITPPNCTNLSSLACRALRTPELSELCTCGMTSDQTTCLTNAIASGGGYHVEAGCRFLLASPGAGNAALVFPNADTTITCDAGAGFELPRRNCTSGTYPGGTSAIGAGCASNTGLADGCGKTSEGGSSADGVCGAVTGGLGGIFAPTGGSSYTVVKGPTGAFIARMIGCEFHLRQDDGFGTCAGGADVGRACKVNGDCLSSTCTTAATGKPSGAGKINPIDFSAATIDQTLKDVLVFDHHVGDFDVKTGGSASGQIEVIRFDDSRSDLASTTLSSANVNIVTAMQDTSGSCITLDDSTFYAGIGTAFLHQAGCANVARSFFNADGTSGTGIDSSTGNGIFQGDTVPTSGVAALLIAGTDAQLVGNFLTATAGPAVRMWGSGVRIIGGYEVCVNASGGCVEFGTLSSYATPTGSNHESIIGATVTNLGGGPSVKFNDAKRVCSRGNRSGLSCTTTDTDPTTGCPGNAACTSSGHQGAVLAACCTGSGTGTCNTHGAPSCPGSGATCCDPTFHSQETVQNITVVAGSPAVDYSAISADTTVSSQVVGNNNIQASTFLGFPSGATTIAGIQANGNTYNGTFASNFSWAYFVGGSLLGNAPPVSLTFAQLGTGTPTEGSGPVKCSDCTPTTTCAGSGSGAMAVYSNGAWHCGTGVGDVTGSSTHTFTNKTFDTAGTGNVFKVNGQQITTQTADSHEHGAGVIVSIATNTAQAGTADLGPTSFIASATAGRYRMCGYLMVSRAATTSSTLGALTLTCTDPSDSIAKTVKISGTNAGNTTGTAAGGCGICDAKTATAVQYGTSGNASSGGTSMQYKFYVTLEAL